MKLNLKNNGIKGFAALCLCASLVACGENPQADLPEEGAVLENTGNASELLASAEGSKRKVIIDTDTGADDASALILAAKDPYIEIEGVTVLVGNVDLEQSTKNALMALEIAGCDAPVYKGSAETFDGTEKIAFSVFGSDGMGDADIIHPSREAEDGDAIDFIIDTVKANPGEIEIIALGPATNVAKAIEKDPEAMKNVKMIWSMGTAGLGPGNASPVAEFNVYADAMAYKIMLDSGLPVTVVGLDVCDDEAQWTDDQFEKLKTQGEVGEFVSLSFGKIRDFYKANGSETVMNCDSVAMMCALYPAFIKDRISTHGSCIADEGETYGMVLFYKEGFTYDAIPNDMIYNVDLITDVDKAGYFEDYLSLISDDK
ncbi:MAG: nucleoside hydrolase [Lachnospiraceae bacterium]|nr:nucleoside hydrolase [Lachnospiraceae bacterium]